MDVQAAAATVPLPSQAHTQSTGSLPPAASESLPGSPAPAPAVSSAPDTDAGTNAGSSGSSSTSSTPGLATLPAGPAPGEKKAVAVGTTLTGNVAKLYNASEQNVSVSFQVEKDPSEIVTVFTDKQTGKVIVQFPSETLVALAQFFDKLDGSVVNKKV